MNQRVIGFCVVVLVVFGFGYLSGSKVEEQPRFTELRQITNEIAEVPDFAALAKKLHEIEEALPKFATKADIDKAITQARDAITEEIHAEITASKDIDYTAAVSTVSYQSDSLEQRVLALEAKVTKLEEVCKSPVNAVSAVQSGGSTGKAVNVSQVPTTVTYQTVSAVAAGNGCWGSASSPQASRTVRVVEPRQPRQVTVVEVPDDSGVSALSFGQCYTDEYGNRICPNASAGQVTSQRRGLLGFRRR